MGLSLTAEQKELLKIFKIEEQYIVPAYQRPYSWGYDHCFQLYNDIIEAYKANEDYFIGNIIIAKSDANKEVLEIIDGQQRLITLLLFIKILSLFQPHLNVLNQILEQEDWEGNKKRPRIKSDVFEAKDGNNLTSILHYNIEDFENRFSECSNKKGQIIEKKCKNRFERNSLYFYSWLLFYKENNDLKDFTSYLLKKIYLLPIELTGKTQDEANEKALIIFETINNRGMNLEDADIFKAKLYKKAKRVNEEDTFIELWVEFKHNCEDLRLEIDDVFRYYSHIIRGEKGITSSEINLREFFTREKISPFEIKKYKEILDDLYKIVEVLNFINTEKRNKSELSKWIQLVEIYTNQYPKFAVVTYLFRNGHQETSKLIDFLKSLIRYIYYSGSTTRVKFEIYNIIKQIYSNQIFKDYYYEVDTNYFNYLGRLKYGYALLAFYQDRKVSLPTYSIDKIILMRDENHLSYDWSQIELETVIDSLGNFVILDIPKKNISISKKNDYYQNSDLNEVRNILPNDISVDGFIERDGRLKEKLINFFKGK